MAGGVGNRGKGRPKGALNKNTVLAKEAIEQAFMGIGGVPRLQKWASENEGDFFKLIFPKLMPVQVNHADHEGGKLVITWRTGNDES